MKEVNLGFLFKLATHLHHLSELEDAKRVEICIASIYVKSDTTQLLEEYPDLTTCRSRGESLIHILSEMDKWGDAFISGNKDTIMNDHSYDSKFKSAISYAKEFETVLLADIEKLTVYHPTQKGIFLTQYLVLKAENAFSKNIIKEFDAKTIEEFRESGRCLAFDNYTACGFHLMRALEFVLHEFYVYQCKPTDEKQTLTSWGAYLSPLYDLCKEDVKSIDKDQKSQIKKVCALLQQIKDQDRNLIMHPAAVLDEDAAIALFDTAKSAMTAMAEQLPDKKEKLK